MRPKSLILLSLALGCGLVASLGINQVMSKGTPPSAPSGETVDVYVASVDIPQNDVIDPAKMLKLEPWPKDKIPGGAITKLEDIKERRARQPIIVGEPILEKKLLPKGEAGSRVTDYILPGYRLVACKVDAVATSGNLIKPGDRVDLMVYLTKNPANGIPESITKTFLQDVKVYAVNSTTTDEDPEGNISAKTVTLEVTPEEAQAVTFCESVGKITLSARRPQDERIDNGSDFSMEDLLAGSSDDSGRDDERESLGSIFRGDTNNDQDNSLLGGLFGSSQAQTNTQVAVVPAGETFQISILRGFDDTEMFEINERGEALPSGQFNGQFRGGSSGNGNPIGPSFQIPGNLNGGNAGTDSGSFDETDSFDDSDDSADDGI